jgi:hypothetical protein
MTQETAHMPLDERGLRRASLAIDSFCASKEVAADIAETAIRAYLQTAAADVSGLVERLKLAAKPSEFRRRNPTLSDTAMAMRHTFEGALFHEAASTIQTLYASNAALEAEIERLRGEAGSDTETAKLYHSNWPISDLLKAREPEGLVTDDGEAWKYQYTHADAKGGKYDLVFRPTAKTAALSAPKGGQDE